MRIMTTAASIVNAIRELSRAIQTLAEAMRELARVIRTR